MSWLKGCAEWQAGDIYNISVPFTWLLKRAETLAMRREMEGFKVRVGGPAVTLRPDMLPARWRRWLCADALPHHNPDATFTSRGCIRQCPFCAVPRIEGDLRELATWDPKPIVCGNNLLACSVRHFDRVIDSLKGLTGVDFNQGLDARLLTAHHIARLKELDLYAVRFSWDAVADEQHVMDAIARFPKKLVRLYVLIGFNDSPDDALYRLTSLKDRGIRPNVMRYQTLTALRRNDYVAPGWTEAELRRFSRYWNRLRWLEHVPFEEYRAGGKRENDNRSESAFARIG